MKNLTQFITEHIVSAWNDDMEDRKKYAKQVFDILTKAYSYLDGGLINGETYEKFIQNYMESPKINLWKLVVRSGKVTACRIYKGNKGGRKSVCIASDGTEQGKTDLMNILKADYNISNRNAWSEVSSKAFTSALKQGALVYPNYIAQELLPEDDLKPMEDGFFYQREIGEGDSKTVHTKVIVGYPPKGEGIKLSAEEIQEFKKLAIKYDEEDKKRNTK